MGLFIKAPTDGARQRALSEVAGSYGHPELLENPRKWRSWPEQGRESTKNPTLWKAWGFFQGITAHAGKELINNFLLLGWHFHTGRFGASRVELKLWPKCLPGCVCQSLGKRQHTEVKLWSLTWPQRPAAWLSVPASSSVNVGP